MFAERTDVEISLKAAEHMIEQLKSTVWVGNDNKEVEVLRKEVIQLKDLLGKRLRVEKRFNEELLEKDSQIHELLDYKKRWNKLRFENEKLEDLVTAL